MNIKRFLHVIAIMFSSLVSLITHGHAAEAVVAKKTKKSPGQLSKSQLSAVKQATAQGSGGSEPPQQKHTVAQMLAAQSMPSTTMFRPLTPVEFPPEAVSQVRPAYPPAYNTPSSPGSMEKTRYPWRQKIVTTTFWIGEEATKNNPVPNRASSWDPAWAENYGGFDNPNTSARKDYIPVNFIPRQNPFYVALPYNDMEKGGFKAEAAQVVPWFKTDYKGPKQSVCKGRWVAIRFNNKTVYAQWEDCGPFRTDHAEYVFGSERPKPNLNHGAGLDVSPAVRDYLGMNDTDVTDWRFVDFDEVPAGPWSKFGDNNTFVINQRAETERVAQARIKADVNLR